MKERLTNNLGLKILAVFLAFFLWLIVSNVSNPQIQKSKDVTVEIVNADILKKSNLTYEVLGKITVTVNYDVHTLDAYKISASDFYAYADVSELYDVTGSIPVHIEVVNNKGLIENPTARPGVIQIKTEEIQRKPFELQVKTVGAPEDGYALGSVTLAPKTVTVTGATSAVGKINSIGVEIRIEGVNADQTGVTVPVFYDANGNKVDLSGDDVKLNTSEIKYQVSVLKVKNLGLDFQTTGDVADGYRFTGVESDIKSISAEGMKSALASLSTLTVPGEYLNLDGAAKDVVVQVDLSKLLPENVSIAGDENTVATITLKVEPLEIRGFKINMEDVEILGVQEGYEYTFNAKSVQVDIEGLSEDLDALKAGDLKPTVNVSGMTEGEHRGTLTLEPGEGFAAVNTEGFYVTVVSTEHPEGETTSADETAEGNTEEKPKETSAHAQDETVKETTKSSDS